MPRNNDKTPWERMQPEKRGERAFHRTETRGMKDESHKGRYGHDHVAEGPNPPRTGNYRSVPKAVFDGRGDARNDRSENQQRRDEKRTAGYDRRRGEGYGERRPGKPSFEERPFRPAGRPMPKASFEPAGRPKASFEPAGREPSRDPVVRHAQERAEKPFIPQAAPEIPENLLVGRNPIREAIRSGHAIEKLLVAKGDLSGAARDIMHMALEQGIVVQEVERNRLDAIYPNHQGMLAYVSAAEYHTVDEMLAAAEAKGEPPFLILLDGVTDPHNLGAIVRSAECVGAHGVIIPERRSVGLTPAAVKAAAGAAEYLPVAKVTNLNRTIEDLQQKGIWVMAAAMNGEDAFTTDLTGAVALVIGSEGDGVSELTMKKCDRVLSLPMKGHIDSLNASVAAGVLMYAVYNARR